MPILNRFNRHVQIAPEIAFGDETGNSYFSSFPLCVLVSVHGNHQYLGAAILLQNLVRSFEPVNERHANVEQDEVRPETGGLCHRFAPIHGLTDDGTVLIGGKERTKRAAHLGMIIRNQNSEWLHIVEKKVLCKLAYGNGNRAAQ